MGTGVAKMSLDELLWKDSDDITIKKLWEYLCTYCYLPRLASYSVLEDAIAKGVHSTEFFGIAAGYTGERYLDLKLNETVFSINQSDLLVKPSIAMKQIMEERKPDAPDSSSMPNSSGGSSEVGGFGVVRGGLSRAAHRLKQTAQTRPLRKIHGSLCLPSWIIPV